MSSTTTLRIVGSGPAALAFALFAVRQGFGAERLRLERFDEPVPAALAGRQLAMSLGSWQLLSRIARLPAAARIETVDVSILGHPGRTRITADEMNAPALGYVLSYGALLASLQRAAESAGLGRGAAQASTGEGAALADEIVVHAEGDTGEDASVREFEQAALLAEVAVEDDHGTTAYECFTANGPLALLPLPEARRYSLVWCAPPEQTRLRAALEPAELAAQLQDAFGWKLGRLSIVSPCVVAPMIRRARRSLVSGNAAWIGNAAQVLHPVGGQGLNLGLRDAFLLARCLGDAQAGTGNARAGLAAYAARRRIDRSGTIALTDALARLFGVSLLRPVQSMALALLDTLPAARGSVARQFMFGLRG